MAAHCASGSLIARHPPMAPLSARAAPAGLPSRTVVAHAFKSTSSAFAGSSASLAAGPAARAAAAAAAARRTPATAVVAAAGGAKGVVAVSGATGLIGEKLVQDLRAQGYAVRVLTRNPAAAKAKLPQPGLEFFGPAQWGAAVRGTAAVVNLAGEPIATRWTPELKAEIKRSRVTVTNALVSAINALPEAERPRVLVSSSAVGYYGNSDTQTFNEASANGSDYLAEVCRDWEAAAARAATRVVVLRTGIVLARGGGALAKMIPVFTIFAGGPLGSGRQWCSWIHRDDVVGMAVAAIGDERWAGTYNAVAPNPVRMGELCSALGSAMGRPSFFPVPDFALQALLGEGAQVVLQGQRVVPARAQAEGFAFKYASVEGALKNILG
jgi:hypothetical protein